MTPSLITVSAVAGTCRTQSSLPWVTMSEEHGPASCPAKTPHSCQTFLHVTEGREAQSPGVTRKETFLASQSSEGQTMASQLMSLLCQQSSTCAAKTKWKPFLSWSPSSHFVECTTSQTHGRVTRSLPGHRI